MKYNSVFLYNDCNAYEKYNVEFAKSCPIDAFKLIANKTTLTAAQSTGTSILYIALVKPENHVDIINAVVKASPGIVGIYFLGGVSFELIHRKCQFPNKNFWIGSLLDIIIQDNNFRKAISLMRSNNILDEAEFMSSEKYRLDIIYTASSQCDPKTVASVFADIFASTVKRISYY